MADKPTTTELTTAVEDANVVENSRKGKKIKTSITRTKTSSSIGCGSNRSTKSNMATPSTSEAEGTPSDPRGQEHVVTGPSSSQPQQQGDDPYAQWNVGQPFGFAAQPPYAAYGQAWMPPPQHMALGNYGGFGTPFPFPFTPDGMAFPDGMINSVAGWDSQSSSEISRATHEMSDDEETPDEGPREPTPTRATPTIVGKEGKFGDMIREQLDTVDATEFGPKVDENLAKLINKFFSDNRPVENLYAVAKQYPRPDNLPVLQTAKIEPEIVAALESREKAIDTTLSAVNKGLVAAIAALLPVANLALDRGKDDDGLDKLSENLMDSMRVLAAASLQVTARRRDNVKLAIHADYTKALQRKSDNPEWLFGGDLMETARQCDLSQKLTDKIARKRGNPSFRGKTSAAPQGAKRGRMRQPQNYGGYGFKSYQYQPRFFPSAGFQPSYPYMPRAQQAFRPQWQTRGRSQFTPRPTNPQAQAPQQDFAKRGTRK